MTNILIDALPVAVEIGGQEYNIDADFRSCLRSLIAFEDSDLTMQEKMLIVYVNLYGEDGPEDVAAALEKAMWFLNGGQEDASEGSKHRVFSWDKDADLIYAGFQQTHRIDLQTVGFMHWWKFLALFMDIGADTVFCNLVSLRSRVASGEATQYEKKAARRMGERFKLDPIDTRSLEQKEQASTFLAEIAEYKRKKANEV